MNNKKSKDKIPTKEEAIKKLKASSRRMLENLIAARSVAPADLSPEDHEKLDQAIAKAERMIEMIDKEFDDKKSTVK